MKTTLAICLTVAACAVSGLVASAADDTSLDPRVRTMQVRLEQQVERIKAARERADAQMNLAKVRSSAQLERSGEELERQMELLERFREELQERTQESDQAVDRFKSDFPNLYDTTMTEIGLQLKQTKGMVAQIQSAVRKLASEQTSNGSGDQAVTGAQLWNAPCGNGAMAPSRTAPPADLDWIPDRLGSPVAPPPVAPSGG